MKKINPTATPRRLSSIKQPLNNGFTSKSPKNKISFHFNNITPKNLVLAGKRTRVVKLWITIPPPYRLTNLIEIKSINTHICK